MPRDQRSIRIVSSHCGRATDFLRQLPEDFPICYFGGSGRFEFLATSFSEVSPDEFLHQTIRPRNAFGYNDLPFKTGYVGLIPYRDSKWAGASQKSRMRIYRVNESLAWDQQRQVIYRCGERDYRDSYALSETFMEKVAQKQVILEPREPGLRLLPDNDKGSYLSMIEGALEDIRSGRFYQINLLRYFQVDGLVNRGHLTRRIGIFGGPFSLLFQFPDYTVASLSPERFIEIHPGESYSQIVTQPIKGTARRSEDPTKDRIAAMLLEKSVKDNAELHIIVDLMRNDLNSICKRGTVAVSSPGQVASYKTIHHLVAEITGRLRANLSFGELIASVLPGGSITGAPKVEVMAAIREYEARPRGFFMGSGFYLDDSGHFDSSILIRTLVSDSADTFEYAAGSGIVIDSAPKDEYAEIEHKCLVVTSHLP